MLVLGDAHASTPDRRDALLAAYRTAESDVALHVGDAEYYDFPAPTWFVAGNNEDFDVIDALRAGERPDGVRNAHLLASTAADVAGLRVAGLSGNFAPTRYDRPRSDLEGDRRRHFTREDVGRAADLEGVDVLLTHEAPTGLLCYGYDPGCDHVNDLLGALDPELCLVGHHHRHRAAEVEGVRTVSLAPIWERYYTLDPDELALAAHGIPADAGPPE
ncbi:metallophosphoesterase [Halobacteriales archaeon QS_5_70_17]|nr:MAG: metallophosphoesterase [Halobacteriales archaeon QS_5_70_17]